LIIARNPHPPVVVPEPKDLLPADLLADLASGNHRTRVGAVRELTELLRQPDLAAAARTVLSERLAVDRDFQVRALIEEALRAAEPEPRAEPIPGPASGDRSAQRTLRAPAPPRRPGPVGSAVRTAAPDDVATPGTSQATATAPSRPPAAPPPAATAPVHRGSRWRAWALVGALALVSAGVLLPERLRRPTTSNVAVLPERSEDPAPTPPVEPVTAPPLVGPDTPSVSPQPTILTTPVAPLVSPQPEQPQAPAVFQDRLKDGSLGPKMVALPKGDFLMGSPETEPERSSDEKQHRVEIAKPFAIGQTEVTFDDYDSFAKETKRKLPEDNGWGRGTRPVINVSWDDATAYAAWLATQTDKAYRLPTEAEWEYAARAGTTTPFFTGKCISTKEANYDGKNEDDYPGCKSKTGVYPAKTLAVASLKPNDWGLYDMAGNVWEWTCSAYANSYDGKEKACLSNNDAKPGPDRVIRGGSWLNWPSWLRSALRFWLAPSHRCDDLGFRLAQDL